MIKKLLKDLAVFIITVLVYLMIILLVGSPIISILLALCVNGWWAVTLIITLPVGFYMIVLLSIADKMNIEDYKENGNDEDIFQ